MPSVRRLAIANRGESAVRCLAAVGELGGEPGVPISTVALYTEPDATALFVRQADEAVPLGPAMITGTGGRHSAYLDIGTLMTGLAAARADSVFVGWGFPESAEFAARCEQAGITFVGPPSDVISLLGDKVRARRLAEKLAIPAVLCRGRAAVPGAEHMRTIAVQVIADEHGTVWPVGIRDRGVQRRDQKVIEESGCPGLRPVTERLLCDAAVRLCHAVGYRSAGTVEFLVDLRTQRFMFMKINTRLQAEHPVTEMTSGVDLVKLQLRIARGDALPPAQPPVTGYAIEARLNAEDPAREFAPAPGRVSALWLPSGPGIRVDAGLTEGDTIAAEFDSMIAKVIAWGQDRDEALSRLRRALAQTVVVIDGGTTNKAFLLSLVSHPEPRAGGHGSRKPGRRTESGDRLPAADPVALLPVALLAAAVEAAEAEQAAVQANFLAAAARGRPALPDEIGHRLLLRSGGSSIETHVYCLGNGDYHVTAGPAVIDLNVRRLGRYERAVTCQGRRYKVIAVSSGSRLHIEVDGSAHVITRDDGRRVRCPCPAFVVAVPVAPGDVVRVGDPLAVVECMKMETAITAPQPGLVAAVFVQANTQVEAGAPLVALLPADTEPGPAGEPASLAGLTGAGDEHSGADVDRMLRAYLLGYDLEHSDARELSRDRERRLAGLQPDDPGVLGSDEEFLEIFADLAALSRRVHQSEGHEHPRSPHEQLLSYLAFLDAKRSGIPGSFLRRLSAALVRYGVHSLVRSPELEQALLRIYRSVDRMPAAAPVVIAVLDRWRRGDVVMTDTRLSILARLIATTQGHQQDVCDLAREVWFCYIEQPVLDRTRATAYARIEGTLTELCGQPEPARLRELADSVVWFPLPMRARLRDRYRDAGQPARERLLEVRTRRYYRKRDLTNVRCQTLGRHLACRADFLDPGPAGEAVHLIAAYVPIADLPAFVSAIVPYLCGSGPGQTVIDLESWREAPIQDDDDMAAELARLLASITGLRELRRLTVTVTSASGDNEHAAEHRRTQSFTYVQTADGFAEDELYRNMHPMLADRLDLWRLSNFSLRRLPSAEDVYLFHAVAHANPKDERLFALAEVRDLAAARDSAGEVIAYPFLEGILTQAFADMRRALRGQPPRQRPLRNRVMLYVRPVWDVPTATWRSLAHRLAPQAADLGLEKLVARIRTPDEVTGDIREAVIDVENVADRGVSVRIRPPAGQPIQPLTEYRQKALRAGRLGVPYPYELIRMLTPPRGAPADFQAGEFTEYDLAEAADELVPVRRPYGRNTAKIVTGVITSYTGLVPEGMRRVMILGDPTDGLGSLAEPECRRILAALALARRLRVPVEWFALSSGARIAWDSGTENMDWIAAVLRGLIEFTQSGGEVNIVVTGINVGAQPYWNAEATMLMHTRGILIMTPASAMVLTGKRSLDYSGGVSAEDNFGIGGFERIMGPNGQAQFWAPTLADACALLLRYYAHTYVVPGERHPRRAPTSDPPDRDIRAFPHRQVDGSEFTTVGDIFSAELNGDRKKPFDMRSVMRAVTDADHEPFERWERWRDAEGAIVWEARIGGFPVCLIGLESRNTARAGFVPADGPSLWTSGTLFPQSSRKVARAVNAASGNRPVVVLANLTGFDGSPESMRLWQLEYGAEIGRAVTNFRGPIVFVVVSRYHGGAFVVFSKRLHDDMETAAVTGSYASVIGGAPAAAVVLSREVSARTQGDPRVASHRERLSTATGGALTDAHHELAEITQAVRAEKLREVADEFDAIHDIRRAMRVGSVDHIIPPEQLRPFVIGALERRLADRPAEPPV